MAEVSYQANPVHASGRYSRISLDPRLAAELSRVASVPPDTREALVQHTITSKWQPDSRAVYGAVVDGFTTEEEIGTVTGMSLSRVRTAIAFLEETGVLRRLT